MPNSATASAATPSIRRRLTVLLYETFLLAAVEIGAIALFMLVTLNAQGALFDHGRNLWLFVVAGAYFVFCWTDSGHTLAMKTWLVKVVMKDGSPVTRKAAIKRYLLAWGWFLPAIIAIYALQLTADKGAVSIAIALGMAAWACTAFLNRERQFLHDRLAGTRLVLLPKMGKAAPLQPGAAS